MICPQTAPQHCLTLTEGTPVCCDCTAHCTINQTVVQAVNFVTVLFLGDPLHNRFCCLRRPQLAHLCQMRGEWG